MTFKPDTVISKDVNKRDGEAKSFCTAANCVTGSNSSFTVISFV